MKPARDTWANPALALGLCAACGALFAWLKAPLPWMLGPLSALAVSNVAGAELRAPTGSRETGQVIIGTALGLYFTPAVTHEVLAYWPILIAGALFAIALGVLGGWTLSRAARTDAITAFFASVPGGATEMTLLGERYGARADRVALAQSLRIVGVVVAVPFALTYSGVHGTDTYQQAAVEVRAERLVLLLALCAAAGCVLARVRVANAFMFGPLAVAASFTAAELPVSAMPGFLSVCGQIGLGCALGARFERRSLASAPRYVFGVLASVLAALAVSALFAVLLARLAGLPWPTLVLAMAPGGLAEMCITAKVLELGVPVVTAAHVVRVFILLATTGPGFRLFRSWRHGFESNK